MGGPKNMASYHLLHADTGHELIPKYGSLTTWFCSVFGFGAPHLRWSENEANITILRVMYEADAALHLGPPYRDDLCLQIAHIL